MVTEYWGPPESMEFEERRDDLADQGPPDHQDLDSKVAKKFPWDQSEMGRDLDLTLEACSRALQARL